MNVRTMHLFAGIGGGLLADLILGHKPVVAVEWDAYACKVLRERAADGWFPGLSVWEGDVRLFDPSEYAGSVDCIHAGFPCQDISVAGKQAGVGTETRSGLYREVLRIAGVVRPRYLFLENVSAIVTNGLGTVLADLAALGYESEWLCLRASDCGANHKRDRWWLLARMENANSARMEEHGPLLTDLPVGSGEAVSGKEQGKDCCNVADPRHTRIFERGQSVDALEYSEFQRGICSNGVSSSGQQEGEILADTECEFCGYAFPEQLGRYGCPNCEGQGIEDVSITYIKGSQRGLQDGRTDSQGWQEQENGCTSECSAGWDGFGNSNWTTIPGLGELADGISDRFCGYWEAEPEIGRVASGVKDRVGQLKGYGNAQVPLQAATAWRLLGGPIA